MLICALPGRSGFIKWQSGAGLLEIRYYQRSVVNYILTGRIHALSEALYGTGPVNSVKEAFIRGVRTGAVMSELENIADTVGPYGVAGERIFGKKSGKAVTPTGTGWDPKGMCGASDPFDLTSGLGNGRGYHSGRAHGGAGHSRTGEGGISLGGFVKDMLTGAVVGGPGSAGFYGAGKAVEELRGECCWAWCKIS